MTPSPETRQRIRVWRASRCGCIELARPEKRNALDRVAAVELAQALAEFEADQDVGVVLITGQGPDFCAGADLAALADMLDAGPDAHVDDARDLGAVFIAIRNMTKPVVAAVRGRALAGGAGLAIACDVVLAHENAQFGYPEVRVGFVPAMVMTMLRRCVGERRAAELVLAGRTVDAQEAAAIGLVSRVFPDSDFDREVGAVVTQLSASPPGAMARTKRLLYALDTLGFDEAIAAGVHANADARTTDEFRAGVSRFIRRPPDER